MKQSSFTKEHTQIAKGVAILLMLAHHLFAFPNRIYIEKPYIPIFSISGENIEFIIGRFGKICVAMYLFLSGYGMYMIFKNKGNITYKEVFNRAKKIYINYWIIFIIFIPISFIIFNREFNLKEFFLNFFALSSSYNGEWWFFRLYIELLFLAPLLKFIITDNFFSSILVIIGISNLGTYVNILINIFIRDKNNIEYINNLLIYKDIYKILFWQLSFCMGYIFAKFDIYTKFNEMFIRKKIDNKIVYMLMIILVIYVRYLIGNSKDIDFILAPIFIFATVNIIYDTIAEDIFILLGKNSTNMWLIHSFFCYQYFQWLVFKPQISILILIWLVVLALISSLFINFIIKKIY